MKKNARRKAATPASRLRPFWLIILVLAAMSASGGYYAAAWLGSLPKRITVSGNHTVSAQEILAQARVAPGENLWLQNMHAAALRIQSIPYIQTAVLRRSLPASVRIEVTERKPFAELRDGTAAVLVDHDLRVLQPASGWTGLPQFVVHAGGLPAVGSYVGMLDVERMRADYDALTQAHVAARRMSYDRFGDLIAVTQSGVRLLLGDDEDFQRKTRLIVPILDQAAADGRRIAALDLRAPQTPVVVYR